MSGRKVILAPLDPVHDVGVKLIAKALVDRGHDVILLPPDLTPEEVVYRASQTSPDFIMVGRTLSYGTAELLARFVDLCDSSGLRQSAKLVLGGMSVRPEMAQELGFDAGFGPDTVPADVADYVEGKTKDRAASGEVRLKTDLVKGYSYMFRDKEIGDRCVAAAKQLLNWASGLTSPAVERASLRLRMEQAREKKDHGAQAALRREYGAKTSGDVRRWYEDGLPVPGTRPLTPEE